MFCRDFLGGSICRIVHHGDMPAVDLGDDLIPEREESILVGFLIFMDMDRRDFKGVVSVGVDFFVGDSFIVLFDVDHQHMEME
jgi:hypothetical protein